MSQVDAYTIPGSPLTMAQLAARLEALFGASVSINRGNGAPTNPVVGMLWWDTSAGGGLEVLKVYRSVGWRSILSLNVNSGLLTWGDTIQIAQGGTGATTAAVARTNLGLGTAAVQPDTRYAHRANNGSDFSNAQAVRENIGAHNATNLTTGTLAAARLPSNMEREKAFRLGNVYGTTTIDGNGLPTGGLFHRGSEATGGATWYWTRDANTRVVTNARRSFTVGGNSEVKAFDLEPAWGGAVSSVTVALSYGVYPTTTDRDTAQKVSLFVVQESGPKKALWVKSTHATTLGVEVWATGVAWWG